MFEFIEEQIKQKSENHFLTHKDFTIALEVVMDMEYLADIGNKRQGLTPMLWFTGATCG